MNAVHLLEHLRSRGVSLHVDGGQLRYRGPRGALTQGLLEQLRDLKPELMRILGALDASPPLPADGDRFPLSYGQRALWFLHQRDPRSAAYHVAFATRIRSPVGTADLESCFRFLVDRHASLRTTYAAAAGEPFQRIGPRRDPVLETWTAADCDLPELRRRVVEAYRRPFDLERGPLFRASLFTRNPRDHVLLLTIHHIACDGWSLWLLQDELSEVYRAIRAGRAPALPPLRHSYADFVAWQSERLRGADGEADWDYWRGRLSGVLPPLELPWDRPRPPIRQDRGASLSFSLSAALTEKLRAYARRRGATLYAVLAAAFQVLLYRHTGQRDLLVGTPTSGRSRTEFQNLIGFFVNPIVLRSDLGGDPSFDDHLDRVRRLILDALDHQDFPFPLLVDRLQVERDLSRPPVFQALFALQRPQMRTAVEALVAPAESNTRLSWDDLVLEPFDIPQQEGQFDFSLEMLESRHTLAGVLKYNTDLLDRATVDRARTHFRLLLEDIVDHSHKRLSELALLDNAERHRLLHRYNDTSTAYPRAACIHELFEQQALATPDAIAVEFQGESLTYAQLDERGNQVAHFLRGHGLREKQRIGVCLSRSPDMLIAVLGVLKAGCGYVPLEPDCPRRRLASMLRDSQPAAVITVAEHGRMFDGSDAAVLCLDSQAGDIAAQPTERLPGGLTAASDVAYVMFTSGSTGQPKGVAVAHRGVVRLVRSTNYARFGSDEVWLQIAPLSFDASTLEIWGALLNGGKLVIAPPGPLSLQDLGQLVASTGITSLLLTAGLFHQQVDFGLAAFAGVRQFFAGGDVLSAPHVRRGLEQLPGCRFINAYGPTENTTIATCHPMTSPTDVGHAVSIGRPISNTHVYVLDAHLEPVPEGVAGELYVAGDGLAVGYVNHPDWTAERFVPDRFPVSPGDRMYKTGDRARWRADGNLEFLGRLDHQVKIRGFRIEPAEIEAALTACDGIREATVVVHRDEHEMKRLVAYLTTGQPEPPAIETLRSSLAARLPEYMIPAQFVWLPALPLTVNGKVDRSALPTPEQSRPRLEQEFLPPTTPTERTLAEIWKVLLGVEAVGIRDNFFALGGHSLLATQVVSRIKHQWRIELPLLRVFDHATIAELAALIDNHGVGEGHAKPAILPAPREAVIPLSFAQERLWILSQLEPDHAFYNIPAAVRIHSRLDPHILRDCLQAVVQRHESLRTTFAMVQGKAVQRVSEAVRVELPVVDLTRWPGETREAEVVRLRREEADRPFELAVGPLFRFRLLRVEDTDFVFLLTLHHIIADGWSMGVLVSELVELYRARTSGAPAHLPELPIQYPDFAFWQRRHLTEEPHERQLAYWREQLRALPTLKLPLDHPRPAVQTFAGATRSLSLDRALVHDLERLSQREDSTLYMTALAAFQTLLVRYTGQTDVAVGSGIANRNRPELERLIGFFVNLQVMRSRVDGSRSFRDLLRQVRQTCLDAYDHQDVPFDRVVRELQPDRNANYNPLCQVCLVFQNFPMPEMQFPGLSVQEMTVAAGTSKFDLTLYLKPDRTGLTVEIEYNTDLFDPGTINRMLNHYAVLLRSVADAPDKSVSELEIFTESERNAVLVESNRTDVAVAGPACVHQWFEQQVARTPNAPAVLFGEEQLSYAQLNQRASGWAADLRRLGVGRGTPVGLCLDRSPELLVGMLAILKAGGAYVPLDPTCPPERLAFMLRDCGAGLLITAADLRSRLPPFDGSILCTDTLSLCTPEWAGELGCVNQARDLAYLIYTSGSTGKPKGVALEHRGLCNLMAYQQRLLGIGPADRVLQFASASFDASVWEIFVTLSAGAAVCLAPREAMLDGEGLITWLQRHAVTIATLPPSVLAVLPDHDLPDLRIIISAGEPCDRTLVRRWRTRSRRFINAYGPTECTVCSTLTDCDPDDRPISIGSPIDNVQAFVLDRWLQPVPVGAVGELHLGGPGLARGYRNRPDLTAAAFVPNPFGGDGSRLYKTGDAARWLPDGRLEFRGRLDQQVKIRGFRIELEEIESTLREHSDVRDAAVVVTTEDGNHPRLIAHVVCGPRATPPPSVSEAWRKERVRHWQELYDDTYRRRAAALNPSFNIVCWDDSYTGQPLQPEIMREWVDETVRRLLALKPRRVLEVGCGFGLLLFPMAPHCEEYLGTDPSQVAVDHVRDRVPAEGLSASIQVHRLSAHELGNLLPRHYDTVVLNSVVQYFPDVDYLVDMLSDAAERAAPGGRLFVGDVRSLPLLDMFHASVEIAQAAGDTSREALRRRIEERRLRDPELVIDPRLFFALDSRLPRIARVEVLLKRGRIHSELTKYRYDVVLHLDHDPFARFADDVRIWGREFRSLLDVERELRRKPACLRIGGVPNARLEHDLAIHRWLHAPGDQPSIEAVRHAARFAASAGIDPEAFWQLGEDHGYDVAVTWSASPQDETVDVWFRTRATAATFPSLTQPPRPLKRDPERTAWQRFANDPLARRRTQLVAEDLRAWMRQRLPEYMVPSAIQFLEAMPLTPTGKIDRQALLAGIQRPGSAGDRHRVPRDDLEKRLAKAWSEVLGVDHVGIDENFFELGGDSILGIKLVARIKAQGLSCSPLQLFQHQTIAELAGVVEPAGVPTAEQGEVTGAVELTPIQHWFFDQEPVQPNHFNQSLLLKTDPSLDLEHLEAALAFLQVHHDALRLRFERHDGRWQATHAPASTVSELKSTGTVLERLDLSGIADVQLAAAIEAASTRVQTSLDLAGGPLFRALHISLGPSHAGRLLLVIHHLVVDAVSWSILLQDLVTAYRQSAAGRPLELPPKTTSFQAWSQRLRQLAASRPPEQAVMRQNGPTLPHSESFPRSHDRGSNTVASCATLSVTLDSSETEELIEQAASVHHVRIDEILVAAFARGYHCWCGQARVAIDLESHGREDLFGDVDVSRTVGWFTSLLPLVLTVPVGGDSNAVLAVVKERLRTMPHRGIHYGISRYLRDERDCGELAASRSPEVAFNYLGRVDRLADLPDGLFSLAHESTGPQRCPASVRRHLLEITGSITAEGLRVDWTYSRNLQTEESVRALAGCFRDALTEIVRCPLRPVQRPTPADFPHATVTQAQLDRLTEQSLDLEDVYDATPTQAGILYHAQAAPASGVYVMQLSGRLSGHQAGESFAEAWLEVIRRHPILRTSFWWTDVERPLQLVHRRAALPVERLDWRELAASAQADAFDQYLQEDRKRSLDLAFGPLVNLTLIRVDDDDTRFVWTHHHLLLDGWSLPLVLQDLIDAFERIQVRGPRKSAPTPLFRDYIAWLRDRDVAASTAFWQAALSGFTTPTALGIDRPGTVARRGTRFEHRVMRISAQKTDSLKALARSRRLTLNTVLQGVWAVLLSRYSGQADVVFGSTVSGRSAPIRGIESMVGMFINTLPTRIAVQGGERWSAWLACLQQQQVALREHEHLALPRIQEVSEIRRGSPLFESLLVFENYPIDDSLRGELGRRLPVHDLRFDERTHYPLTLTIDPGPELRITIRFDAERFDSSAIDRMTTHLESVLEQVTADPDKRLSDLCILGPHERRHLAVELNRTAMEYPRDSGAAELFEAAAARTPDRIAVTAGGIDSTYACLNGRANQFARHIRSLGVQPGDRVGICLDRSHDMVVALLGILKAGAVYVPLDPGFPVERVRFMLEDAQVRLLVTQRSLAATYDGLAPAVLCMDAATDPFAGHEADDLPSHSRSGDLAYVIYTSGSTGRPKGVQIPHGALVNFLTSMQRTLEIRPSDTLLAVTTISFDIAALELYLPLLTGGRVVIAEGRQASDGMQIGDLIRDSKATIMQATPATWRMMLEAGWQPDPALRILVGGEALETKLARRLVDGGGSVWNLYGPTETTVWSTIARLRPGLEGVTIGSPIANTQVYLLDSQLQMVPVGVAGELYIGGDGLARGYLNRPDWTASRFVPNPFGNSAGGRIYRTGDLCRWLPDGSLEFLGRLDDQVKVRGHRIELGEIEKVLSLHPAILEAAAAVRPDDSGESQLVAYLRLATNARPSVSHLRSFLHSKLPGFMIPASFVFLDAFPRTANGKLDRKALPEPTGARPDLDPPYVAPRTPLEASLAAIWSEVLGIEKVGIHDNFFDLGGASMNALRIVAKAQMNGIVADPSLFRPELVFEHPTIAAWAALIDEQKTRLGVPRP
jgi:amino acid adenylation domain-containing protein/non-ribosomal peptide synthase protein (TIGR01720 family)